MDFNSWIAIGREHGFCSLPVCNTHDITPMSEEEDNEWEEGGDPCIVVVRVYQTNNEYTQVEGHTPTLNGT